MKMLEVSWYSKEATEANVMAVLTRTHIFLNTETSLYVRPASEKQTPVIRFPLGDKTDYLHVDSRSVYDYHRKGGTDMPADLSYKVAWEVDWVTKAMAGSQDLPMRPTIINDNRNFFAGDPVPPAESSHDDASIRFNREFSSSSFASPLPDQPPIKQDFYMYFSTVLLFVVCLVIRV